MKKKNLWWGIALGLVLIGGYFLAPVVRLALAANRQGFFEGTEKRTYTPERMANLEAIATALTLTYESEGTMPPAKTWMDELFKRMKTSDMTEADAKKKFVRPGVAEGAYGYCLVESVGGKAISELPEKGATPVIWECDATGWNQTIPSSKGTTPKDAKAITAEGKIIDSSTGSNG